MHLIRAQLKYLKCMIMGIFSKRFLFNNNSKHIHLNQIKIYPVNKVSKYTSQFYHECLYVMIINEYWLFIFMSMKDFGDGHVHLLVLYFLH